MIVIPAGSFRMGSSETLTEREGITAKRGARERPIHEVSFSRPFAIGKFEVTRGEYARFVAATNRTGGAGCKFYTGSKFVVDPTKSWRDPGYPQTDRHPAACISWEDAKAYAAWLATETGKPYRLPSEAEWEYTARAGTATARFWGDDAAGACRFANAYDRIGARTKEFPNMTPHDCADGRERTAPVGSYRANAFGVHDTAGNVWEWQEDCWHKTYEGAPSNGSAWIGSGRCSQRILRGGSWISTPRYVRSGNRSKFNLDARVYRNGFRVARSLEP